MELQSPGYMAEALRLAAQGRYSTFPNPRVGCVIVQSDRIVGRGWHARAGEAHAEIHALREAGSDSQGADLYVTLEPCAHHGRTGPCVNAVIQAGIKRVWVAMQDPNPQVSGKGMALLREAGVEVQCGLLEPQARQLNRGFVSRMERGRPLLSLKLGASLDGRTAMASGESQWITDEASRADVHRLRAEAGAVLSTSATVLADDPSLTVRDFQGGERQPDRIVIDSTGRLSESARVWRADGARRFWVLGGQVVELDGAARKPEVPVGAGASLDAILRQLAEREINSLLVECGPRFAGALLSAGLVDELVCYVAPSILGSDARGLAVLPGLSQLAERVRLSFSEVRKVGSDLRITAIPRPG